MTVPAVVPWFYDREVRNGSPDSASLTRRLARWQRWAKSRGFATPNDSFRYLTWSINQTPTVPTGSIFVPAPLVPSRRLRIWAYVLGSAGTGAKIRFVSRRTGQAFEHAFGIVSYSWVTFDLAVDAPDVFDVWTSNMTSGSTFRVTAMTAYFVPDPPSGAMVDTAWSALPQAFYAAGRADSVFPLRWLARKANQFTVERTTVALAAQNAYNTDSAGMLGTHGCVVPVASKVPSLTVKMLVRATSATTVTVALCDPPGGSTTASANNAITADGVPRWYTFTLPCAFATARPVGLVNGATGLAPAILSMSVWENPLAAADLSLPGAETVPASFIELSDASILSGTPILADLDAAGSGARGRAALVKNMVWLWAKKTRQVYCQTGPQTVTRYDTANNPSKSTLGIHLVRATPDGWTKQIRCRAATYLLAGAALGQQYAAWAQWKADNGGAAAWAELAREYPVATATEHDALWTASEDHSLVSGAEFVFRREWGNPAADANPAFYHYGAMFEELPDGTPTTTWP